MSLNRRFLIYCPLSWLSNAVIGLYLIISMANYVSPQTGTIHIDIHGRSLESLGPLAKSRIMYLREYPICLADPSRLVVVNDASCVL